MHHVDLHLFVGDIGHRINGQLRERPRANKRQDQRHHHHEVAMGDGELKDALEHGSVGVVVAGAGLA